MIVNSATHPQRIRQLVTDPKVREVDAAVLVMLYALRHEGHPNTDLKGLVSALNKRSVGDRYLKARDQWSGVYRSVLSSY